MRHTARICGLALAALLAPSVAVHAEGTVWLPAPGATSLTVARVSQEADDFWHIVDGRMAHTPFGPGLDQTSTLFSGTYGISDALALDAQLGWSEASNKDSNGPHPTLDGRVDTNVGLTWRFADELLGETPSMAVRFGAILQGDYDTAYPTAIGDGADGFELSGIVGKVFADRVALSGEVGTRNRGSDVPRETFVSLDAHLIASSMLVLSAEYHLQRSDGDRDIHGPGFTRFVLPFVAEEFGRVSLGGSLSFERFDVSLRWYDVTDGRNAADYSAIAGAFTYHIGR